MCEKYVMLLKTQNIPSKVSNMVPKMSKCLKTLPLFTTQLTHMFLFATVLKPIPTHALMVKVT